MRTELKASALALSLVLGACSKHEEPTAGLSDDLKKDLSSAAAPGLATAPQSYKRMRFVSDIEQSRATERVVRAKVGHDAHHIAAGGAPATETTSEAASNALETMAATAPVTVATTESAIPEPSVVVAARPAPEAETAQGGPSASTDVLDHAGSSGGGVRIHGTGVGTSVIRGGRAPIAKCDPRSDGVWPASRPDFSMPSPVGRSVFGGGGRR